MKKFYGDNIASQEILFVLEHQKCYKAGKKKIPCPKYCHKTWEYGLKFGLILKKTLDRLLLKLKKVKTKTFIEV